jgi:hypothetical protein
MLHPRHGITAGEEVVQIQRLRRGPVFDLVIVGPVAVVVGRWAAGAEGFSVQDVGSE